MLLQQECLFHFLVQPSLHFAMPRSGQGSGTQEWSISLRAIRSQTLLAVTLRERYFDLGFDFEDALNCKASAKGINLQKRHEEYDLANRSRDFETFPALMNWSNRLFSMMMSQMFWIPKQFWVQAPYHDEIDQDQQSLLEKYSFDSRWSSSKEVLTTEFHLVRLLRELLNFDQPRL